ncbi:hypothetical protein HDF16_001152 [Granulicella aggregans]|uniref:DUF2029 domain-containing protein n=1 Tax=Granulicella aggregans TaxID=474949 RepID=A0A7W7ZB02_9BACT|nr:glycosyltransferase 87 family protein [Granulicella aggregans]MBB5056467.1 hypothetical protein [Granulicella aggregans]
MTGSQTLIARVGIGVVAALASVFLTRWSTLRTISRARFDRIVFGLFAVSRLGLFALIFLVVKIAPRGDVPAYYFDQARQVLAGLLPYRDFISSYAPLHPYLDAGLISAWHSPLSIVLFSVLVEMAILPLWLSAGRVFLPEAELRVAALLYLASPVSLQFVTIDGQDNVVIAVLLALSLLLVLRSRAFAAGASFGASVAAIKFLPLLYAPAFFFSAPRRWRMAAGAAVICGVVYGGCLLAGAPILTPLSAEGDLWSAGDLPYVIEAIFGVSIPPRLTDGFVLLALVAIFVWVGRSARQASIATRMRALNYGMAALTLAFLVFSKKSWPPYLMLALFPICLLVAGGGVVRERWKVAAFAVFSVVSVTEHSYWASSLAQFNSAKFHQALLSGEVGAVLMLLLELLLIAGYLWLLWEAVSRILSFAATEDAVSQGN